MESIKKKIIIYFNIYTDIVSKMVHKKYSYMDTEGWFALYAQELMNGDIRNSMQIYWREILIRTHFASVTSIVRNQKWLMGVLLGLENKNLMIFCSSLRGFLESAVDSYYSMEELPTALSLNFSNINSAVKGELNQQLISQDIENKLIHFQFAKKGKYRGGIKTALSNTEYISSFDFDGMIGVKELYSTLCEITHPASNSISCFTTEIVVSENNSYSTTSSATDSGKISTLLTDYSEQIAQLLKMSLSLSVVCLKILLMYDFNDVHSEYIETCIFNKIISKDAWNRYLKMMEDGS